MGERLPTDREECTTPEAGAVEELVLRLSGPRMLTQDGTRQAWATAQLVHEPAQPGRRAVDSRLFGFTAPLGPIEAADLRWYLESYHLWPVGVFLRPRGRDRGPAAAVGAGAAFRGPGDGRAFAAWERAGRDGAVRRFSVLVDEVQPAPAQYVPGLMRSGRRPVYQRRPRPLLSCARPGEPFAVLRTPDPGACRVAGIEREGDDMTATTTTTTMGPAGYRPGRSRRSPCLTGKPSRGRAKGTTG